MGSARGKMTGNRLPAGLNKTKKAIQKLNGAAKVQIRTDLPQEDPAAMLPLSHLPLLHAQPSVIIKVCLYFEQSLF